MKRTIPIVMILITVSVGGYWWFTRPPAAASEPINLVASGTIEAEGVSISAELGGRVIELKADEGDEVREGQVLIELDKADLWAQEAQLEAALVAAKANLELVRAGPQSEEGVAAQAQLAQAGAARDGARLTWESTVALADEPHELDARINQARARVAEAERNLEMTQVNLKRAEIQAEAAGRDQSGHDALVQKEAAQYQLQAARVGVQMAEVALDGANRQVEHLIQLRKKPLQLITQVNAAEAAYRRANAAVLAAQTNLAAVEAGATHEDVALAEAQVREAEAALAVVEIQMAKQTLTAPRDGLVSQVLVNRGELAPPGALLLEIKDLDTVELTVYIAEDQVGPVRIGQKALVSVDAYEEELFEGTVNFVAHEAEFTPRNVQTQEERVNLVFAVKIRLDNPDHRLKPGMPADAQILRDF